MKKEAVPRLPKPSTIRPDIDVPDLVRDPASHVEVSAGGRDRGPVIGHGRKARSAHPDVERADVQYEQDKTRHTVTRIVDTLAALRNRGSISEALYVAGKRFQDAFDAAHFESIPSMRYDGMPPSGKASSDPHRPPAIVDARTEVFGALKAMGGMDSPCGIAAWWILGMRWSLRELAQREHINRVHVWSGTLIGALGVLESHYSETDRNGRARRFVPDRP